MENIKLKIRERYGQMSKAEKQISDFVLSDARQCMSMTAVDIAKASRVSSASVIRYVQKLGYEGLEKFKLALASAESYDNGWKMVDPIISQDDDLDSLCRKMSVLVETAFKDFFYQLDKAALREAIETVKRARKIYVFGLGASMLSAYNLFHNLKRADFDAHFYFDVHMMTEFFNYIDERDVAIAFSYSGQTQEVIYPCKIAGQQGTKVIAVTRNHDSPLQRIADIRLFVPDKEAVMRIGAFTSLHTSVMMANLLYLGVIQEDFDRIEVELVKTRKLVEGLKTNI